MSTRAASEAALCIFYAGVAATALEDNAELLRTMLESEREGHGGTAENGHASPRPSNAAQHQISGHDAPQPAAGQQGLRERCALLGQAEHEHWYTAVLRHRRHLLEN